jgi:SPP1 gp7 family putative phage head morphogenesis protein
VRPPVSLANQYAAYLRKRYSAIEAKAVPAMLEGWDEGDHMPHRGVRSDAHSHDAIAKLIRIQEEHKVPGAHLERFAAEVSKHNARQLKVVGVPTHSLGAPEDAFRDRNLALIKKLDAQQVTELRAILEDAQRNATRVELLRAQIQERFDVAKSHADLIARDQTLKLNGDLTRYRQQSAGISHYEWSTSNDERVRPDHADLDGTIQDWNFPPVTDERTGARNHPGGDYQCRCVGLPIIE